MSTQSESGFSSTSVEAIITGDRLEISTSDKSNLELVAGHDFPDGQWYCHIDDMGGVRLYLEFEDAINGSIEKALDLVAPSSKQEISVHTRDSRFAATARCGMELTTARNSVDITSLGEEFVAQFRVA